MRRNRHLLILINLIIIGITLNGISFAQSWVNSEIITANSGSEAPVIDGIKDDLWYADNVNVSYYDFSGRQITLYILYVGESLYILIELKNFQTSQDTEQFSIYISSSNSSDEASFIDKKTIILYNASQKGNETSEFKDLHKEGGDYVEDVNSSLSYGVARYGDGVNRLYEFNISRTSINATENNNLTIGNAYAFKVGFKSGTLTEQISEPFIVQMGPKITQEEGQIGEKQVNWVLFTQIVHWIVFGLMGVYGILILKNRKKIGLIKQDLAKMKKED